MTGQHILWTWARLSCNALELPGAAKIGEWAVTRTGEGGPCSKWGILTYSTVLVVPPAGTARQGKIDAQGKKNAQNNREISCPRPNATLHDCYPGEAGEQGKPCAGEPLRAEETPGAVLALACGAQPRLTMKMMKMGVAAGLFRRIRGPSAVLTHGLVAGNAG